MFDFLLVATRSTKKGDFEIYPKFIIKRSDSLMIRGGDFYAIWVEERGLWSDDEQDAIRLIDQCLDKYKTENIHKFDGHVRVLHMWDAESGMIDCWHRYCQKQMRDSFHMLDETIIFSNHQTTKTDYASKKLSYPLCEGECPEYELLMSTLYEPGERKKIEWAIGAIVSGEARRIQKFMVLYGAAGTGKSTVLDIIQQLFDGYHTVFDARALGSSSNAFALESFKNNPLVAIQHDGDLSKIEDNTRLNSLVSHELMSVNEKFKSTYANKFQCFLLMGTNKPVKITDAKSGLIRRLIDVTPSGNKLASKEYKHAIQAIKFELGAIAYHCQEVYMQNRGIYDDYIPTAMLGASNDFYNFVEESYSVFTKEKGVTLKIAWEMYKTYCDDAKVGYPFSQRAFKEELKNYFGEYTDRHVYEDGTRARSYYSEFIKDKFICHGPTTLDEPKPAENNSWMAFDSTVSLFDTEMSSCSAQYASSKDTPSKKWDSVTTSLKDINTSELHYVKVPENHIVIDFDIKDDCGNKSFELNLKEASKWPPTYAELSKSGGGIHLHYNYVGDVSKLSRVYDDHIEIKVFTGNSSLRRKVSKCNDIATADISSGLPLRGENSMINFEALKNEKGLRTLIKKNLRKEIHPGTKPSIDFINKLLTDMYNSGVGYDVSDLQHSIILFAANSSNNADYCLSVVNKMKFKSETQTDPVVSEKPRIVFYDVEVFPNLFVVCWKKQGKDNQVVSMINPTAAEIGQLINFDLVGFNCRRYDNHILYGRMIGYTNEQLYELSQKIIKNHKNAMFGEAYNISYTDIYDFSSKKQSLKKFEIELGIHHNELGLPWDKPVPENLWKKVSDYCCDDVIATEETFNDRQPDFVARQILADIAGMTVNDTTNTLTTRIIFGNNRNPQSQFNYRNMGEVLDDCNGSTITKDLVIYNDFGDRYTMFNNKGQPVFPGYIYEYGKSTYRDEEVSEGGYVYSEPGIYGNVALLDVAAMHPNSAINENLFGDEYTARYQEILDIRIAIKHRDFDKARKMMGGALAKYLTDESTADNLSVALKIAINSVYGLTAAKFANAFKDPRNIDNIVAKRGALFMINLKHEVQARGFVVAHIKTDSIKIPDATTEIIDFVMEYGKQYWYTFEHEATYERMALVNKAVYIAKYDKNGIRNKGGKHAGEWTATGTQFAEPYVYKTLFSKEDISFDDLCQTVAVTSALYLDMNESLGPYEHSYHFVGKVGRFCPMIAGSGGGTLLREKENKDGTIGYASASGTKGYVWMESEMVKQFGLVDSIDRSYYDALVTDAVKEIEEYGDFEWFISNDPYVGPKFVDGKPVYWDETTY